VWYNSVLKLASNKKSMIVRTDPLQKVKLIMFERVDMPESEMKEGADGKKSFVKTGKTVEMTSYTFRDAAGSKLVVMSKENGYRSLEGEIVDVDLDVKFNDFTKTIRVSLAAVRKAQPQL